MNTYHLVELNDWNVNEVEFYQIGDFIE